MDSKLNKDRFIFLILFSYVILGSDSLVFATNSDDFFIMVGQIILVFVSMLFLIIYLRKVKSITSADFVIILISFLIVLTGLLNNFSGAYLLKISLIIFGYTFSRLVDFKIFISFFISWMKVIGIFSLFTHIFREVFINFEILPIISNYNDIPFKWVLFSNVPLWDFISHRNFGPFWEPGVFAAYLLIALFLSLFFSEKVKISNILIFSVTILSTFSTTGITVMLLFFVLFFIEKFPNFFHSMKAVFISIVLTLMILLVADHFAGNAVLGKLIEGSGNDSFGSRLDSVLVNIKIFFQNPFFGAGIREHNVLFRNYSSSIYSVNTNTVLSNFSIFGFFVGSFKLCLIFAFISKGLKRIFPLFLAFLAFNFVLFSSYYMYSIFFNLIFFYGFDCKIRNQV